MKEEQQTRGYCDTIYFYLVCTKLTNSSSRNVHRFDDTESIIQFIVLRISFPFRLISANASFSDADILRRRISYSLLHRQSERMYGWFLLTSTPSSSTSYITVQTRACCCSLCISYFCREFLTKL